ncbi:MAG TPA: hypothetical protein PKB15_01755 [Acidimicrobiia bacterium]|nr:hypothetical protein [Acidimicrobiia bacterium]
MEFKNSHTEQCQWPQVEIAMSAAEAFVSELFDQADNDVLYHHRVSSVRYALAHGHCSMYKPEEIAESILAWSGAL